jgi:hypothetical protein
MKSFTLLLAITLLPNFVIAEEIDEQINKACLRHAVSLVAKLKTDVVGELSQEKSDQALKIATDSCQAYFKKEFSHNPEAVAAAKNQSEDDDGVTDWLTKKILSGDTSRKEGNNRIKKIK